MAKTTQPETPRAKKKRRTLEKRVSQLEVRLDQVETVVVQRLAQFEATVIEKLSHFSTSEYKGRNTFRIAMIAGVVLIIGVLFYIDGN